MKYQLTIIADDAAELVNLLSLVGGKKEEKPVPPKVGKQQKLKLEEPVEEPEEEDVQEPEEDVDDSDEVTLEVLQKKVSAKAQLGLRDKIKKLLAKFNAAKVSELDEDDYSSFNEGLEKIK